MADGSPLTLDRLRQRVAAGDVDTVIVAFTDLQGRLQGERVHAARFLDDVLAHGTRAGAYLLAVDVEMATGDGGGSPSWGANYGDVVLRPDLDTLRAASWQPATALVLCDVHWPDGTAVTQSPRQVLRAQARRAADHGLRALAATELEFLVFRDTYEQAWDAGYRGLTPAGRYNGDHSVLGAGQVEPLLRDLRAATAAAGLRVESVTGERNLGQHEIAFQQDDVVAAADHHAVYRTAAKEIAAAHGASLTFMARFDEREGNACHLRLALRSPDGAPSFADGPSGYPPALRSFIAGVLGTMREFTLLYAPNVNSYKRFAGGGSAPTAVTWGEDNRTCALRVVGNGTGLRLENRVPGGDVNPYLALAAMLAGGLHGVESDLPLEPAYRGDARTADRTRLPATLAEAREEFALSQIARLACGDEVVDHYVRAADVELAAFGRAVTDWERRRGFERL